MTRARKDLDETTEAILNCWLVYHGVNLAEAVEVEFTGYGYMIIQYRDDPTLQAVTLELDTPL